MAFNTNIYNINWNKLVSWLIPSPLFKPKLFAWLKGLVSPINKTHGDLLTFRKQKLYELGITPQVCYLQKLLNDRFDYVGRGIYISDGTKSTDVWLALDSENNDLWLPLDGETEPIWLPLDNEVGANAAHFVVNVPTNIVFNEAIAKSLLNKNKLPSRRYRFNYY